jgi:RNA polymerase sigma-70 factor (ECF subfamily)
MERGRCATWRVRSACSGPGASWYRPRVVDEASDVELVREILAGGALAQASEAALCRRFAPRIRLYGLKHLRDEERARDLVQTVLVGVLQAARSGRIDDPSRVDRFVLGTCRNTVARMRHQDARVPLASEEAVAALVAAPPERIEFGALFGCVSGLENRAKQILIMSFLEERSADEIATALSLASGNVRVIRHRALAAVRQCLEGGKVQA